MTRTELIRYIAENQHSLSRQDIDLAAKCILEKMSQALASGNWIKIRWFGGFSLHYCHPRIIRDHEAGEAINLGTKCAPYFKAENELRERVTKQGDFL